MRTPEHYINHAKELWQEAILMEGHPLDKFKHDKLKKFLQLGDSDKLFVILQTIKRVLPENFYEKLKFAKEKMYDIKKLPFKDNANSWEGIIGRGCRSRVYLLKSLKQELPSYVLKIFRDTYIKKTFKDLDDLIEKHKNEIQQIKKWYTPDLDDIFLPEYMLVTKDPITRKKSLAIVQPYQSGEIKDIFDEISEEDLIKLLNRKIELKNKFVSFVDQTLARARKNRETLDLVGDKNLSIVSNDEDKYKLIILDPHNIHNLEDEKSKSVKVCWQRLFYLESIKNKLTTE